MKLVNNLTKILLISITSFVFLPNAKGFLDSDLGLNLYENIDKGIYELELKLFQKELKGTNKDTEVSEALNKFTQDTYGLDPCFKPGLKIPSPDYIEINKVYNYLDDSCKGSDGKISTEFLTLYQKAINYYILIAKVNSEEKAKTINSISRIGLYSDGDTDNSPFDIIHDLKEIDNVIFGEELEYNGEDVGFLSKFKSDPFYKSTDTESTGNPGGNGGNGDNGSSDDSGNNNTIPNDDGNTIICPADESGLNPEELQNILNNIGNNNNIPNNGIGPILPETNQIGTTDFNGTNYTSINDNNKWPCDGFFCINVDFKTHRQNLLGYGKTKSIQGLLETSNGHLKLMANTSGMQFKMTTGNFEPGFKSDLNLQNMFHMGFNISYKSPPLLDLENIIKHTEDNQTAEDIKNGKDPELTKQLRKYYKNLGLDYNRANDLNIFSKVDEEMSNVTNSAELNPITVGERQSNIAQIETLLTKLNSYTNDSIDKQATEDILKEFYLEFIELERFTSNMSDYTITINTLIKKLREIPIYN